MYVVVAILDGLGVGASCFAVVGLAVHLPHLGWLHQCVLPFFYVVGMPAGMFVGLRSGRAL